MARRQTRKMTRSKAWNQPACYKTGNYIFVYSSLDNVSSAEFYLYSTGNSAFEHSVGHQSTSILCEANPCSPARHSIVSRAMQAWNPAQYHT